MIDAKLNVRLGDMPKQRIPNSERMSIGQAEQ